LLQCRSALAGTPAWPILCEIEAQLEFLFVSRCGANGWHFDNQVAKRQFAPRSNPSGAAGAPSIPTSLRWACA